MPARSVAVVFDMDGVLTDTTELHYRGWQVLADELGLPFDRTVYDRMRGLARPESLAVVLGERAGQISEPERQRILARKNEDFLARVARLTPDDLLPGVAGLLAELGRRGVPLAVASSSRNAAPVLARLGIAERFNVIVDGNTATRSKPDPQVFTLAAERLGVPAAQCVVIEDGAAGVAAARTAGMRVVGVGPAERVSGAHLIVGRMADLTAEAVLGLRASPA